MPNEKLTKFQKEVIKVLEKSGYKHAHFNRYDKWGQSSVDVTKTTSIAGLMSVMYQCGKVDKIWEVKRALEVD